VSLWERLHDEAYGEADAIHDEVYAKRLRESKPQPSFSHLRAETMDEWLSRFKYVGGKFDRKGKLRVAGTWVPR
jgi:hypothetical protein